MDYSKETNKRRQRRSKLKTERVTNKVAVIAFRAVITIVIVGVFALAGGLVGAYMGILENAPKLAIANDLEDLNLNYTTIIYDNNGVEFDRLDSGENREYATSSQIPDVLKHAFVAIEDERFYEHDGVDYKGFARAMVENVKNIMEDSDSPTQGASTITQQLIKNKLNLKRNTPTTKLQEQYLAIQYEEDLTEAFGGLANGGREKAKDYILELYLNIIALGGRQYGVQAAALHYFGKDVSEIKLEEACIIAAITQNPSANDPFRFPDKNRRRADTALDYMLRLGFITQEEYDNADFDKAYADIQATKQVILEQPSFHSYYVDQVIEDVIRDLAAQNGWSTMEASNYVYRSGLQIFTNLDQKIQAVVDEAYAGDDWFPADIFQVELRYTISTRNTLTNKVTHHPEVRKDIPSFDAVEAMVEELRDRYLGPDDIIEGESIYATPQPQGSFVIIDQFTGKVAALSGGRGEKLTDRSWNRATKSERQPGSVFKVLASYAPALDMGLITPGTVLDDVPYIYPDYQDYAPNNWYNHEAFPYRGLNTVRNGIRNSMNVITVKNMYDTGVANTYNYLLNFGFTTLTAQDGHNLSTSLGGVTTGVTTMETAAAYAAIANGGTYIEPTLYSKVLDRNGNVVLEKTPETHMVIKQTTSYLLTNMMIDAVNNGTGGRARFSEVKMPISGKTGTTSGTKDLTFAGYTPYYTAAVWLGFDMPLEMPNSNSNTRDMHLRIWSHIMEEIHRGLEYKDFERPSGITSAKICTVSGKLAVEGLCDHDPRGASIVRNEIYAAGTQPTEPCTQHMVYTVCKDSRMTPHEGCPAESVETKVGFVRLIPFDGPEKVADKDYEVPKAVLEHEACTLHSHSSVPGGPIIDEPGGMDNPGTGTPGVPDSPAADYQTLEEYLEYLKKLQENAFNPIPTPTPVTIPTPTPTQDVNTVPGL